jgi:hypothetical protein
VSGFVNGGTEVSSAWTFRDASGKMLRRFDKQNVSGQWNCVWREDYLAGRLHLQWQPNAGFEEQLPPETRHFFTDHLGTPRLIIDNGGMQIGLLHPNAFRRVDMRFARLHRFTPNLHALPVGLTRAT